MGNKKEEKVRFQLRQIELTSSRLNHKSLELTDKTVYDFDIEIKQSFNIEKGLAIVKTRTNIIEKESDLELGGIEVVYVFKFDDLSSLVEKESNELKMPSDVVQQMNTIAVSTSRGVLYSEFRGTYLHKAVMPVIDFSKAEVKRD